MRGFLANPINTSVYSFQRDDKNQILKERNLQPKPLFPPVVKTCETKKVRNKMLKTLILKKLFHF